MLSVWRDRVGDSTTCGHLNAGGVETDDQLSRQTRVREVSEGKHNLLKYVMTEPKTVKYATRNSYFEYSQIHHEFDTSPLFGIFLNSTYSDLRVKLVSCY